VKKRWDKKTGLGRKKIFEVRRTHNDVTFLDTFLNEEFCLAQKLFVYGVNRRTGQYEISIATGGRSATSCCSP